MTAATLQVDTALSHIMSSLPPGTKSVTPSGDGATVFPIIAYGLTSRQASIVPARHDDCPTSSFSAPTCRSRLCQTLPLPAQAPQVLLRSVRRIRELFAKRRNIGESSPSAGKLLRLRLNRQ